MKNKLAIGLAAIGVAAVMQGTALAEALKVAVVLPGVVTDKSFNENVYQGLTRARDELGVEIAYTEKVPQPSQVEVMSDYARRGYDVVVGAGAEYTDAAKRVARQFPDIDVIVLNGAPTDGVATINYDNQQFGYVLGLAAGHGSETGKIAALSAQQVPAFEQVVEGYRAGFNAVRPDGEVLVAYTNDWADIAKAKEASLNVISQGADVLLPYLDAGFLGVVQAAEERDVHVVGVVRDLSGEYPEVNLLSTVLDFGGALYQAVELAQNEAIEPRDYRFGIGTDAGYLGGFNAEASQEMRDAVAAAVEKMQAGELDPSAE
ncbi:BMP family protein [Aquibium sp. A9E412]|uniref:BMP family protein n=1 Tax=Aquibium sp. A9E412 TaxID=2976767 RepID=UPI0025B0C43F|nr:BMP family protein [Aquibium sp. A9E412]MDN2565534.1 BMP family protein [Aquibium sp. A9E412]